jgi:hypothetical protein
VEFDRVKTLLKILLFDGSNKKNCNLQYKRLGSSELQSKFKRKMAKVYNSFCKVAGSNPDEVNHFFFNLRNPSSRIMALDLLASSRNEYQKIFLGLKRGRCVRLTT